jgi:hypothetical protein
MGHDANCTRWIRNCRKWEATRADTPALAVVPAPVAAAPEQPDLKISRRRMRKLRQAAKE